MRPYRRYQIQTADAPPVVRETNRFSVRINKLGFGQMVAGVLRDGRTPRRVLQILSSRPCIYGVYDNPLGGLRAEESLCRGCMRCMVEHPEVARIEINPAYRRLGDGYWKPEQVLTVWHEAATGRVPVRGAGYDGPFKGPGFDSIWTDMSEIVRPTRDGIHGREFISTVVELGQTPVRLRFDGNDVGPEVADDGGTFFEIPVPILLDALPAAVVGEPVQRALAIAAARTGTLCLLPPGESLGGGNDGPRRSGGREAASSVSDAARVAEAPDAAHVVPTVRLAADSPSALSDEQSLTELERGAAGHRMVTVMANGDVHWERLRQRISQDVVLCVRLALGPGVEDTAVEAARAGVGCLHLCADYHGRGPDDRFVSDGIRAVHDRLVEESLREKVAIIAGGGIIMAEHVPKAILCGADAVAIDTATLVALQCGFEGDLRTSSGARISVPPIEHPWGVQRVVNLLGAWHSQLLEVLGAMGLREVRRMRGELGRTIFSDEIEAQVLAPLFENGRGHE